jgi:anti-sigma B factor antagonist
MCELLYGRSAVSPQDPGLDVVETWAEQVVVIAVAGDLDLLTAPRLEDAIHSALRKQPTALIVDLTKVKFLASIAIDVLVVAHREITPTARFSVVADGPGTSRPMQVMGIDNIVALYPTLGTALAACRPQ